MHKTGWSLQAPFQQKANKSLDRDRFEVRLQRVGGPEGSEMAEKLTRERSRGWETCSWISEASSALLRVCVNENTNNEHVPVDLACTYTRCCTSIDLTQPILTSQQSSPDVTEGLFNSRIDRERLNDLAQTHTHDQDLVEGEALSSFVF